MTTDTGAVARIVEGLREIVERWEREERRFHRDRQTTATTASPTPMLLAASVARECLAIAERER